MTPRFSPHASLPRCVKYYHVKPPPGDDTEGLRRTYQLGAATTVSDVKEDLKKGLFVFKITWGEVGFARVAIEKGSEVARFAPQK